MNDPNGVIHWDGRYHLFFQYNPDGAWHANMHWGHAVSDDLTHWTELPIAIAPTPDSPDQGGVFSGCVVDDHGTPKAIYTGVNDDYQIQVQCLATGNADLTRWSKHPANPIISDVPAHLRQTHDFRDPFVWRQDDSWYMALGSHIVGVGGAVLLYRSDNLLDWEYLNPLFVGDAARHGFNFECPNFFPLGDKWVLIVSAQYSRALAHSLYFVGRFENHRFIPEREAVFDPGYSYASLSHIDGDGRRLIYSWIREGRSVEAQREAGWTGVQAIPRELWLDEQERLCSRPVPEFEQLRGRHWRFNGSELDTGEVAVRGLSLDIEAEFDAGAAETCGMALACSLCGAEKATISYERDTRTLRIERHYRHEDPNVDSAAQGVAHPLDPGEKLRLRILLDGSVIEVIANDRKTITSRFYPSSRDSQGVAIIGPEAVQTLDIWELESIW